MPEAWHELLDDAVSIPGSRAWVWSRASVPWSDLEGNCEQKMVTHLRSCIPSSSKGPSKAILRVIVQFCCTVNWVLGGKKVVSFPRHLVKMPDTTCFWHFQLLLNNSLASVTANVDLKALVHFSTQMLSRQAWVLTNIFRACPRQVKMSF